MKLSINYSAIINSLDLEFSVIIEKIDKLNKARELLQQSIDILKDLNKQESKQKANKM